MDIAPVGVTLIGSGSRKYLGIQLVFETSISSVPILNFYPGCRADQNPASRSYAGQD